MADFVGNSRFPTDFGQKELLQWDNDEDGFCVSLAVHCSAIIMSPGYVYYGGLRALEHPSCDKHD